MSNINEIILNDNETRKINVSVSEFLDADETVTGVVIDTQKIVSTTEADSPATLTGSTPDPVVILQDNKGFELIAVTNDLATGETHRVRTTVTTSDSNIFKVDVYVSVR